MPRFNPYRRFIGAFLPNCILQLPSISQGAKLAWGRLAQYAGEDGEAYPSLKTLGEELGVKEAQARRYVEELEAVRLIEREDQPGKPSRYWHLDEHPCFGTPTVNGTPAINGGEGYHICNAGVPSMVPEENQEEIHEENHSPRVSENSHPPKNQDLDLIAWIEAECARLDVRPGFHSTSPKVKRALREVDSPGLRLQISQILEDESGKQRNITALVTSLVNFNGHVARGSPAPQRRKVYEHTPVERPVRPEKESPMARVNRVLAKMDRGEL